MSGRTLTLRLDEHHADALAAVMLQMRIGVASKAIMRLLVEWPRAVERIRRLEASNRDMRDAISDLARANEQRALGRDLYESAAKRIGELSG
ncbi:MAG: hypothetical protein OXF96_06860 [Chloroflexi bacterium]|nr:hypothetical protein [Chloroflexota bacterium]